MDYDLSLLVVELVEWVAPVADGIDLGLINCKLGSGYYPPPPRI